MRLYTMANDARIADVERFVEYARVFVPGAPLYVIPFDDEMANVRAALDRHPDARVVQPNPKLDVAAQRLFLSRPYRPGVPAWRYVRKLNAFLGHNEKFVFLDANTVPLVNLVPIVQRIHMAKNRVLFRGPSVPRRTLRTEEVSALFKQFDPGLEHGFNCGAFVSQGGTVRMNLVDAICNRRWRMQIGQAPEQGLLAVYMALFCINPALLSSVAPDYDFSAGDGDAIDGGDVLKVTRFNAERTLALVKYIGTVHTPERDVLRNFLERHRLARDAATVA